VQQAAPAQQAVPAQQAIPASRMPQPGRAELKTETRQRVTEPNRSTLSPARPVGLGRDSFTGLGVLVVDDDLRNLFAMTALLEGCSANVTIAESGDDALVALRDDPAIDIILMDIMMPVMDGYDTIRAIRALEQFASIPILAVTGKVVEGERERCIAAGADDYIVKPVDSSHLLVSLQTWLPTSAPRPS
jgi:CheY-like chemotaxis protein